MSTTSLPTRAAIAAATFGLSVPAVCTAAEPAVGTRLSLSVSGDLLIHSPVYNRALAYGGGSRYEFRLMLRAVRPVIARADLS